LKDFNSALQCTTA